jgi:DNA-directed RNA polymerase specialized sigma24 family protein
MSSSTSKLNRENLFRKIKSTLLQWSDLEQKIFTQAHYLGKSPKTISSHLKLDVEKVNVILERCNLKLLTSLSHLSHGTSLPR